MVSIFTRNLRLPQLMNLLRWAWGEAQRRDLSPNGDLFTFLTFRNDFLH